MRVNKIEKIPIIGALPVVIILFMSHANTNVHITIVAIMNFFFTM